MTGNPVFIHLRNHSAFSLLEGAIKVGKLVDLAVDQKMPAVAITDTNNLFGAMEFSQKASKAGVQPIIGTQIDVTYDKNMPSAPMVLLCQSEIGYRNLIKMVSRAFMETDASSEPHTTLDQMLELHEGLICLSGAAEGPLGQLIHVHRKEDALALCQNLKSVFGDRFYIELQRHNLPIETETEDIFIDWATSENIPLVATNNCHFKAAKEYRAHEALLCIAHGRYLTDDNRPRKTIDHRFKTQNEMKELFSDLPEAILNTAQIAKRCGFMLEWTKPIFPVYDLPGDKNSETVLREKTLEGLNERLEKFVYPKQPDGFDKEAFKQTYLDRMEYELEILMNKGFADYFLVVSDFMQWCVAQDIPIGPGRGSGAGSLVAYALGITGLNPFDFGLLFERFLNPERKSLPDFDIDFCQSRRDEVIRYVQDKYGHDRVAQIITFGKLQPRAVVRDVGRVLQMPYGQVDKISKLIPNNPNKPVTLTEAIDGEPLLQEMRDEDENVQQLLEIGLQLEGLYRHASTHAAGVVIGDRPLEDLIPLYRDPKSDMPVSQFHMVDVETAGLVKFDFLGLKTLSVIKEAETLLAGIGITLDANNLPLDDKKTYEMLAHGQTTGVFQLESGGMKDLCRQMKVEKIEEIIALVALFRPGPMQFIPQYIAVKHGKEDPDYMYPSLEPILEETYGIMIYQEQVMSAAQILAKYSLGEADILRRAMGKKKKEVMDAERDKFVMRAVENDVPEDKANEIFDKIAMFAGYGFNKSHSACYAYIGYQTAYLKANHTVSFLAASMTYDMGNTDKLSLFKQELQNFGIELLPPDVNKSSTKFTVEKLPDSDDYAVRYALTAIKGVGANAIESLVTAREQGGDFKDLYDFITRVDTKALNRRQMEILAAAGAFDCLNGNRAQTHAAAEQVLRYGSADAADKEAGQDSLFGGGNAVQMDQPPLPDMKEWPAMERLKNEFDTIGFYLSAHPLDTEIDGLKKLGVVLSNDLSQQEGGKIAKMAGVINKVTEKISGKGNRYAFVQLSDPTGLYEVTVFSDLLSSSREVLQAGNMVLCSVSIQKQDEDDIRLTANSFETLTEQINRTASDLTIDFDKDANPAILFDHLKTIEKGRVKLNLSITIDDKDVLIDLQGKWNLTQDVKINLQDVDGVKSIRMN